jgi:hypothetical protein
MLQRLLEALAGDDAFTVWVQFHSDSDYWPGCGLVAADSFGIVVLRDCSGAPTEYFVPWTSIQYVRVEENE